jgi:hypothetical protein
MSFYEKGSRTSNNAKCANPHRRGNHRTARPLALTTLRRLQQPDVLHACDYSWDPRTPLSNLFGPPVRIGVGTSVPTYSGSSAS